MTVHQDAESLLEGGLKYMAYEGGLHIIDMNWRPGIFPVMPDKEWVPANFTVYCTCGSDFTCKADEGGIAKCSVCGAQKTVRLLALEWYFLPKENMMKPYAVKVECLYEQLLARVDSELRLLKKIGGKDADPVELRPLQIRLGWLYPLLKKMVMAEAPKGKKC